MPTTTIKQVSNENDSDKSGWLLFINLEDKSKNRYIAHAKGPSQPFNLEINSAVPWCSSHEEFLQKGIIVVNRFDAKVLGCIWQDHEKSDPTKDFVRFDRSGWQPASAGNKIPGYSEVGGNINLKIEKNGNISAVKVNEKASVSAVTVGEGEIPVEAASR